MAEGADQGAIEGADRTRRDLIVGGVAEDDVLVAVVRLGRQTHLRPLPAEEGDDVGILRIARERIAVANRLLRLPPVLRRDRLGVVVDAPEVERGAEAGEVAGVGGRVRALALQHRQAADERIGGERRVHVEVAEQDLLRGGQGGASRRLCGGARDRSSFGTRPAEADPGPSCLPRHAVSASSVATAMQAVRPMRPPSGGQPCTRQFSLSMKEPRHGSPVRPCLSS